jgi:hypothetical protein
MITGIIMVACLTAVPRSAWSGAESDFSRDVTGRDDGRDRIVAG